MDEPIDGVNEVQPAVAPEPTVDVAENQAETGVATPSDNVVVETNEIPQDNAKSAAWAELRRKAKEAEEYKEKLEKLSTRLPEGYDSIDDFLNELNEDSTESTEDISATGQLDKDKIKKIVEELPEIQEVRKSKYNAFLVDNFRLVQQSFPDIKEPLDIPNEVWNMWNEGKSGRTLLSVMKEHRYDTDIVKAKQQGVNQAKANIMSTAHTSKVIGTPPASDFEGVTVDAETEAMLTKAGIPKEKHKMYYQKYHRTS